MSRVNSSTIIKWLFAGGFFLLPLIYWPNHLIPYEIPKVWFVNRWTEILGFTALVSVPFNLKKGKLDTLLISAALCFLLITAFSSLFGVDLHKSFWGNYYRHDGIYTLIHLYMLLFVTALYFKLQWLVTFAKSISLGVVATGLFSLYYGINYYLLDKISIPNFEGAIGGTFGQPNFLTGYFVTVFPFLFYARDKSKTNLEKMIFFFPIIISVMSIVLTRSKAGLIILPLIFMLNRYLSPHKLKKNIGFYLISGLIMLSLAIFLSVNYLSTRNSDSLVAEGRTRIFTKGLLAFADRPVLGWGWANFDYAFESVDWPIKILHDVYVDKAHSDLLEVLVTTGLVGFAAYMVIITRSLLNLNNRKRLKPLFFSFVLLIIHSQTNIVSVSEEALFYFLIGMAAKGPDFN